MKKQELENKIEATLNSLDHITRSTPGPFFYTRVLGRLQRKDRTLWEKASFFIARPAVAFAVICLVLSLNGLVIFQSETAPVIREQNSFTSSEDSDLEIIAVYDEENNNNTDFQ